MTVDALQAPPENMGKPQISPPPPPKAQILNEGKRPSYKVPFGPECFADESPTLTVRPLGSSVLIGPADDRITGTIVGVAMYAASNGGVRVSYQVAYWNGRTRSEQWMEACEVNGNDGEPMRIGFSK